LSTEANKADLNRQQENKITEKIKQKLNKNNKIKKEKKNYLIDLKENTIKQREIERVLNPYSECATLTSQRERERD
jgi:Na+/phosphate symporter